MGKYELNKLTSLRMCSFIAQLVEHRPVFAEVMGLNPVEALNFFRLHVSNCLNWKIYCDDHSFIFLRRFEVIVTPLSVSDKYLQVLEFKQMESIICILNLVGFICLSFLVISFSKQMITLHI